MTAMIMKIEQKNLPKSQFELVVEIPAEKWKVYYDRAAKHLAEHVNVPGFRKGKINAKVLEQNIGTAAIFEELAEIAINDSFHQAVKEKDLTPIGQPKIDVLKLAPDNPIIYKAVFAVLPKVELKDYKKYIFEAGIKLEEAKAEEKEINESIDYLLNSRAKLTPVTRGAQKGDRVEVDFSTKMGNVKLEKGESKNHPLIIGKSHFLPEFEAQIIGMITGTEKQFDVLYPADYFSKELAGKNVTFNVKMNSVQEIITPEFNDEFVKMLGNFSDAAALKKSLTEGIVAEKTIKEKEKFRGKIIDHLVKKFGSLDLPDILIEAEKDRIMAEVKYNIESHGMKFDEYIAQIKKTEADLRKEWDETAKNRINTFIINYEIAKIENIKANKEEIDAEINKFLANYKNTAHAEKDVDMEKLTHNIQDYLINNKVFELLESIALGKKK